MKITTISKVNEIEDLYKTLTLTLYFEGLGEFLAYSFNIYFDIQKTLDDDIHLNVYNKTIMHGETEFYLLKSFPALDGLKILETLINDPRIIIHCIYDGLDFDDKTGEDIETYYDDVDIYNLTSEEVAKLRTIRDKILEEISYGD